MTAEISGSSVVVAAQDQISCDLAGEAAILSVGSGKYHGLNAVGSHIWNLVQKPTSVSDIRDALLQEYDVEPERCEQDLIALLQELALSGLIEIHSTNETDP